MIELFLWKWGLYLIIIYSFIFSSCSPVPPSSQGYWIDDGPYRGTLRANRDYIRPYWECAEKRMLKSPCIERKQ